MKITFTVEIETTSNRLDDDLERLLLDTLKDEDRISKAKLSNINIQLDDIITEEVEYYEERKEEEELRGILHEAF